MKSSVVCPAPNVCGGHAILKGHRIEVSNLVADLFYGGLGTPEQWIDEFEAWSWISPDEILIALRYCRDKHCVRDGLTCCHCTLNPEENGRRSAVKSQSGRFTVGTGVMS